MPFYIDQPGVSSPNAVSPILPGVRGVFDTLAHKLRLQNPAAFKLPKSIWSQFEGGKVLHIFYGVCNFIYP